MMIKYISAFIMTIIVVTGTSCSGAGVVSYSNPESAVSDLLEKTPAPGAAVVVTSDDRIIWEGYSGQADRRNDVSAETLFMLASVSKTVTLTALLHLWETGAFDLDDDVSDYLGYKLSHPEYPEIPITFRMLMQHNSGIHDRFLFYMSQYTIGSGGGDWTGNLDDFLFSYLHPDGGNFTARNYTDSPPGTEYEYSNLGVALLAVLLERISGIGFPEYCRRYIFVPLEMDSTAWFLSDLDEFSGRIAKPFFLGRFRTQYGYPDYPSGQLRSTARDVGKFAAMWAGKGKLGSIRLLRVETVDVALQMDSFGSGLIWHKVEIGIPDLAGHSGGDLGVFTKIVIDPAKGTALVVLTNGQAKNNPIYAELYRTLLTSTGKYE